MSRRAAPKAHSPAAHSAKASPVKWTAWQVLRRPDYREDLDAIEAWIARDNAVAAIKGRGDVLEGEIDLMESMLGTP